MVLIGGPGTASGNCSERRNVLSFCRAERPGRFHIGLGGQCSPSCPQLINAVDEVSGLAENTVEIVDYSRSKRSQTVSLLFN